MSKVVQGRAKFVARLCLLVLIALLTVLFLTRQASGEEVLAVLPWFCGALVCYLAPSFVSKSTDIFSPPGLTGIQGGLAVSSMIASASVMGSASFALLGPLPEAQRIDLTRSVMTLLIVSQLAYLFGYYCSSGALVLRSLPSVKNRRWDGRRLIVAVVLSTGVFMAIYSLFQQRMGGSILDLSVLGRGKVMLKDDPSLSWMARGIAFGFVPVLLLTCAAIADRSRRMLLMSAGFFCVVALLVTRTGQRGTAVGAGLAILVVFHFLWRKVPLLLVLGILLVAIVGVNILGEYRQKGESDTSFGGGLSQPVTTVALHEQDRQRLNALGVIMYTFPERHDYLAGESYYAFLTVLVPRWIWPEKAQYFLWRDTAIVFNLTGLPAPTPLSGVLYANFSWIGVVVGMMLFGAFHRGLYRYLVESPGDPGTALIYISILGSFAPTMIGVSQTLQLVVPIVLLVYAVSRNVRVSPSRLAASSGHVGAQPGSIVPVTPE